MYVTINGILLLGSCLCDLVFALDIASFLYYVDCLANRLILCYSFIKILLKFFFYLGILMSFIILCSISLGFVLIFTMRIGNLTWVSRQSQVSHKSLFLEQKLLHFQIRHIQTGLEEAALGTFKRWAAHYTIGFNLLLLLALVFVG